MRPVPVFPDYLVKIVIPASRAILKPAVIYRCVSLNFLLVCQTQAIVGPINSEKRESELEDEGCPRACGSSPTVRHWWRGVYAGVASACAVRFSVPVGGDGSEKCAWEFQWEIVASGVAVGSVQQGSPAALGIDSLVKPWCSSYVCNVSLTHTNKTPSLQPPPELGFAQPPLAARAWRTTRMTCRL